MNQSTEERFTNTKNSKTLRNIISIFELDKRSVLDIGCSFGEFLINFGKNSVGVTISKEEASYGKNKGLNVVLGNVESKDFLLNQKFDVVFSNNLLEHLYSPHDFLYNIKKYFKPDGFLILGVPCVPYISGLVGMKKFRGSFAEAHINFFTRNTLKETVARAGYKVTSVRGFRLANGFLDSLLNPIYPHFYVIAKPNWDFKYPPKRELELSGYSNTDYTTR